MTMTMVRPHVRLATAALLRAAHAAVRGDREAAERAAAAAADAAAMAVRALVGGGADADGRLAQALLAQALLALAQLALAVAHDDDEPGGDLVRLAALEAQAFRALARGYAHGADAAHAQALAAARRRLVQAQQARANAEPDMMGVAARRSYRRAATAAAMRAIDGALQNVHRW